MEPARPSRPPLIGLAVALVVALWLRFPAINYGLPYFYEEDEAHHFNRTVEMVKSGDFNPRYFHKPSLHFYLRMPLVALGFVSSVRKGEIRSVKEIRTRDPQGIGGYAFSASHPRIVKFNRALSVLFSLALVAGAFVAAWEIFATPLAAFSAAILTALSPELIRYSGIVGVDGLMAMMCMLATLATIRLSAGGGRAALIVAGLTAGLAVSSKYNALPICVLPLLASLFWRRGDLSSHLIALVTPAAGFIVGTPYLLASLPLFLDQLAYEIWHYGIAGHAEHMAEPGLPQAAFYLDWLKDAALGASPLLFAIVGAFLAFLVKRTNQHGKALVFLVFPALFFALMCMQKANFVRNMLVIVPYLAVLAGGAISFAASRPAGRSGGPVGMAIGALLLTLCGLESAAGALALREELSASPFESRLTLERWLTSELAGREAAVDARLQPASSTARLPRVATLDLAERSPIDLYLDGFDLIAASGESAAALDPLPYLSSIQELGDAGERRILRNPRIKIFQIDRAKAEESASQSPPAATLEPAGPAGELTCPLRAEGALLREEGEEHCWVARRIVRMELPPSLVSAGPQDRPAVILLRAMSPWPEEQELAFSLPGWKHELRLQPSSAGAWTDLKLEIPGELLAKHAGIEVRVSRIHSPADLGSSQDGRRLGVALARFSVL